MSLRVKAQVQSGLRGPIVPSSPPCRSTAVSGPLPGHSLCLKAWPQESASPLLLLQAFAPMSPWEAFPDPLLPGPRISISLHSTPVLTLCISFPVCLPTPEWGLKDGGGLFYCSRSCKPEPGTVSGLQWVSGIFASVSPFWTVGTYNGLTHNLWLMTSFCWSMHGLLLFSYVVIFTNIIST